MTDIDPAADSQTDPLGDARAAIAPLIRADETALVQRLLGARTPPSPAVADLASRLVVQVRSTRRRAGSLDAFLQEFELSSREGLALMCLAEALLRIPDADTADRLIRDKLSDADWAAHLGNSDSIWVNASTLALMLTGRVVSQIDDQPSAKPGSFVDIGSALGRLIARGGEPVIRQATIRAMHILGGQFVMGRTIGEALDRAAKESDICSFDMLGEGARTAADAASYRDAYSAAINALGARDTAGPINGHGISIKLSALFPRYEVAHNARVQIEAYATLVDLAVQARERNLGFTVDAEEAARLDLSLDLFGRLAAEPVLAGWDGLGLAMQAYQRRATAVIGWLQALAEATNRRLMVRLVKGAYWDTEIKHAQQAGLDSFPVFTRKPATDLSYLVCAQMLLADPRAFYPQFATHNAHTVASVINLAGDNDGYEFQRLHGMGEPLYDALREQVESPAPVRVYAPVGSHEELLAYLARRLLENGANTSFVNRIVDEDAPVEDLIADPALAFIDLSAVVNPAIRAPRDIYGPDRRNAIGIDLDDPTATTPLLADIATAAEPGWSAAPVIGGVAQTGPLTAITDPADHRRVVGHVVNAGLDHAAAAMTSAAQAAPEWAATPAGQRADCLRRAAAALEHDLPHFMAMAIREAGKTIPDAIAEIREAIDFLRYYALRADADFATPHVLPGPTGERNEISLHGRGVFVCISPWNFPLAIFIGQVSAALVAGNAVVAKPAPQTPLVAAAAIALLHDAGVPGEVLQLIPGGADVGAALVADSRCAGVAFTGSTAAAWSINRALAVKQGPIVPLIAETGGQNAMVVDSSALPEQVVDDVVASAFRSAGQRCSALRVLFLQDDIADTMIRMLAGAMAELQIGDPMQLATDVGPVIDTGARDMLMQHADHMAATATTLAVLDLPAVAASGSFFAPRMVEIDGISVLQGEVFGPFLHVVRYDDQNLDAVADAINATGFGLTVGIHSRIDSTVERLTARIHAGNAYVNRNMIGAVVGSQPFGGEGLSGTGPKAGGPRYLHRFAVERVISTDTTAAGGNAELMTRETDDV